MPELLNFKKACALSGLSEQRFRKLVVTGKLPAHKDELGFWKFDKAELEAALANRPKRSGTFARREDGRVPWKLYATLAEAEAIQKALSPGMTLVRQKNKPKAKKSASTVVVPASPQGR